MPFLNNSQLKACIQYITLGMFFFSYKINKLESKQIREFDLSEEAEEYSNVVGVAILESFAAENPNPLLGIESFYNFC